MHTYTLVNHEKLTLVRSKIQMRKQKWRYGIWIVVTAKVLLVCPKEASICVDMSEVIGQCCWKY